VLHLLQPSLSHPGWSGASSDDDGKGLTALMGNFVKDKGNFCTVETMIFLPSSRICAGRPIVPHAHYGSDLHELLNRFLCIWSFEIRRSVTTITESKTSLSLRLTPMS